MTGWSRLLAFDIACYALCAALVAGKLTGALSWPWWLVTAPVWVPVALILMAIPTVFLAAVLHEAAHLSDSRRKDRQP